MNRPLALAALAAVSMPGVSGTLRRNGDAWAAADYDALGAKANLVWGPRTGLSLQYTRRSVFGSVPPVVVTTPALFFVGLSAAY